MASGGRDNLAIRARPRNDGPMVDVHTTVATTYRILLIEGYNKVIEQLTPFGPTFGNLEQAETYYDRHELWRGAYGSTEDNREYRIVQVRAREEGRIYFADRQIPWQNGKPVTADRSPDGQTLRIWLEGDRLCWEAVDPKTWN